MQNDNRYISHCGILPTEYQQGFETVVYYHSSYLQLQDIPTSNCHYLIDTVSKTIVGMIVIHDIGNGNQISLSKAPFGSFIISKNLTTTAIDDWILSLVDNNLKIKHPSSIYGNISNKLIEEKASHTIYDLNHHIILSDYTIGKLHNMQMRRIRKCKNAGFKFRIVYEQSHLRDTHAFLKKCRKEQGLEINISCEKLIESFDALPDHYYAFQILDSDENLIAASILIKVTDQIIYNYLPASSKSHNKYSPMSFLLFRLALFFKERSFQIMDLGLTSIEGEEQESLAIFKERMGAIRTDKPTYIFQK